MYGEAIRFESGSFCNWDLKPIDLFIQKKSHSPPIGIGSECEINVYKFCDLYFQITDLF